MKRLLNILGLKKDNFEKYQSVLNKYKGTLSFDNPKYPKTICDFLVFSWKLYRQGDYEKFIQAYRICLSHLENLLGKSSSEHYLMAVNGLANFGITFRMNGDYENAEELLKAFLIHHENIHGKVNHEYSRALSELALTYEALGKMSEAEKSYTSALEISKDIYGIESEEYGCILYNFADYYMNQKNFEKAEELYIESLNIRRKVLGKNHYQCAESLNNLAAIYELFQKDYNKAESCFDEALEIAESNFGRNHINYLKISYNLALLCRKIKKWKKAESLLKNCINNSSNKHYIHTNSLNELALLSIDTGCYDDAEYYSLKDLEFSEKNVGKYHPDYIISLETLAQVYEKSGKKDKALQTRKIISSIKQGVNP